MPANLDQQPSMGRDCAPRVYGSDILSTSQALKAKLADLDVAYASDLETVRNSTTDEVLKRKVAKTLQEQHRARRAPYVRHLKSLEQQFRNSAATPQIPPGSTGRSVDEVTR